MPFGGEKVGTYIPPLTKGKSPDISRPQIVAFLERLI
jgi:hypothetical protein